MLSSYFPPMESKKDDIKYKIMLSNGSGEKHTLYLIETGESYI